MASGHLFKSFVSVVAYVWLLFSLLFLFDGFSWQLIKDITSSGLDIFNSNNAHHTSFLAAVAVTVGLVYGLIGVYFCHFTKNPVLEKNVSQGVNQFAGFLFVYSFLPIAIVFLMGAYFMVFNGFLIEIWDKLVVKESDVGMKAFGVFVGIIAPTALVFGCGLMIALVGLGIKSLRNYRKFGPVDMTFNKSEFQLGDKVVANIFLKEKIISTTDSHYQCTYSYLRAFARQYSTDVQYLEKTKVSYHPTQTGTQVVIEFTLPSKVTRAEGIISEETYTWAVHFSCKYKNGAFSSGWMFNVNIV